jgi:hypothetical protein
MQKRILVKDRIRRPPADGFSWVDRKFVHEFVPQLSQEAILLYFFLAAVSDKVGLSYYRDDSVAARLRIRHTHFCEARDELVRHDLIAFERPLTQVLSLPCAKGRRQQAGGLHAMRELFREPQQASEQASSSKQSPSEPQ